jgi:signal peptidase I
MPRAPLIAIGVALLIVTATLLFLIRPIRIEGESMSPALRQGDVVLVWIGPGVSRHSVAGSVVVVRVPGEDGIGQDLVVKRVTSIEGSADLERWALAGDNSAASRDSRDYGTVPAARLVGVVWVRIYPRPGAVPAPNAGSR